MLKLTEKAIAQIKQIMNEQKFDMEKTYIRVGILGQNCSGTVYSFYLDDSFNESVDDLISQDEIKVVFGKDSTEQLAPVTIDYKEENDKKGFVFSNPLQVLTGGCSSGGCSGGTCG